MATIRIIMDIMASIQIITDVTTTIHTIGVTTTGHTFHGAGDILEVVEIMVDRHMAERHTMMGRERVLMMDTIIINE